MVEIGRVIITTAKVMLRHGNNTMTENRLGSTFPNVTFFYKYLIG